MLLKLLNLCGQVLVSGLDLVLEPADLLVFGVGNRLQLLILANLNRFQPFFLLLQFLFELLKLLLVSFSGLRTRLLSLGIQIIKPRSGLSVDFLYLV